MTDVAWFIPSLIEGSGGHRTLLQHAHALEQHGYRCHIYLEGSGSPSAAAETVRRLFGFEFRSVHFGWDNIAPADIAIASIWYSATVVRDLPFECTRCYFVQDYEAVFNPVGDTYLLAENSYRYGLLPITIGRWLKHELNTKFQVSARHFNFGADTTVYRQLANIKREQAVCFIYQPDKPRRCSRIGLEALQIVHHRRPDVKIYLYGSVPDKSIHIWFKHEHMGLLSLEDCNLLYNRCSVGLCLSASNPSRIPFEMMAAGLPVVEFWRENNLYDLPPEAASLSDQTPEGLAEAIVRLLDDPQTREQMSVAGQQFMADRTMQNETDTVADIIAEFHKGADLPIEEVQPLYNRAPIKGDFRTDFPRGVALTYLVQPSRSRLNALPPPVRRVLRWGYRKARNFLLAEA